jgi:MoxR-like ATPase
MEEVISRSPVRPVRMGRSEEVEALNANATSRRATLIAGPAGIGKTQLSSEAVQIGEGLGYSALVGHCTKEQVTPTRRS